MSIRVKLNDLNYRYDVYQVINLFFPFYDIDFTSEGYDISVGISESNVCITFREEKAEFILEDNIRKKEAIKKSIFMFLKRLTGLNNPWGIMLGIRPSKIALELLDKGLTENEIIGYYSDHYLASGEKAKLCIEVASFEKKIVNRDSRTVSVYIGMPFCPTRCSYCSFASNPIGACRDIVEPYIEKLGREIVELGKYIEQNKLKIECIYFGGGTPTSINDLQFERLMSIIYEHFYRDRCIREFTVECGRPDSITEEKLNTMKRYGVDRISVNPQTMNDKTLRAIGRNHSVEDVVEIYRLARNLGFDNINMDLIVGLPGEGLEEVKRTFGEIMELNPDNITVHGMSIKRASKLHEDIILGDRIQGLDILELEKMYDVTRDLAEALGMKPYYMYRQKNMAGNMENVGYSKNGKEGIYNVQMIEEKQTIIALGADAVSKVVFPDENRIERFANVKDVREYINRFEEMLEKKFKLLDSLYKKV